MFENWSWFGITMLIVLIMIIFLVGIIIGEWQGTRYLIHGFWVYPNGQECVGTPNNISSWSCTAGRT